MPVSITWTNFFNNYLRPALNDTTTSIVDSSRANLLTLFVLSDLQAKGLTDITSTVSSGAITSLDANVIDAWNLIGFGVKYYFVNDPVVKYDSASGTSITRDRELIEKAQTDYFLHLRAYITINKLATLTAAEFWTQQDVIDLIGSGASKTCCKDSLEDKLALIAREEQKDLTIGDQKRLTAIELRQLERSYELEDKAALIEKSATNGAWTSAGQFTVSYLVDYQTELEDTVPLFQLDLDNDSFGIPTIVNVQTYSGGFIDTAKYKRLDIELVATANVSFILKELVGLTWQNVGTLTTDNTIVKSYSLVNTNVIKVEVTGTQANTQLFIRGTLKGY
ncbi:MULTISPECIES: hypothetical protein [Nostocales]|uniref:Uncharacterized protein n=1 Tax=Dolichospermum flos-aquae UHCC 0037 TaxID=2590026 RepID=A0ACC7S8N4_DOLFA|nr:MULTISPECIES: hypothetical protein [Nostocales]MBO1065140.1 hypothetical protein [Anabaena sp. 54]MTJ44878.1 hypothetical protein [Dolichospermum flos-aquae UHCC 0037]